MLLKRFAAALRPSGDNAEVARIHAYEPTQREICATAGAAFDPPDHSKLVALAPSVLAGHLPVRGTRHVGESVEWFILADDEPVPPIDQLSLQHLHHLASLREDLVMYLALPVGWSFAVLNDGGRTWAAFAPSDQLRGHIDDFFSTDRNPRTAEMIQGILDESFSDLEAAGQLSQELGEFINGGHETAGLEAALRGIVGLVRGTQGDYRVTLGGAD